MGKINFHLFFANVILQKIMLIYFIQTWFGEKFKN